jgi:hypothetical protein
MDKYTKALLLVLKIPVGIVCILMGLGFIGVSVWVSTFSDVASMILLISLLGGGFLINYGLGYAFLGDEYKATRIVRDGDTTFTPILSTKFLKRRKIVTLIGFIAYVLLSLFYVVRAIWSGVYMAYLEEIGYTSNIVALIIFAVLSAVVAFCLLMVYKKTKHIDLNEQ